MGTLIGCISYHPGFFFILCRRSGDKTSEVTDGWCEREVVFLDGFLSQTRSIYAICIGSELARLQDGALERRIVNLI